MRRLFLWLSLAGVTFSSATVLRPLEVNITYSDLLLITAALLATCLRWNGRSILGDVRTAAFLGLGIVLFYAGFVLALYSGDPLQFLLAAFQYAFCFFLLPYIFSRSDQCSPVACERSCRLFLIALAVTSGGGFFGYFLANDLLRSLDLVSQNDRFQGFVSNPNRFSSLLTLSIPLLFGLRALRGISQTALVMVLVCFIGGLIVASSFGGLLSTAATLLAIASVNFKVAPALKGAAVMAVLGTVLIAIFGLPEIFEKRVVSKLSGGVNYSQLGSFDTRLAVAEEAMDYIVESPVIGVGLDSYLVHTAFGHTVHNTVVLVWAEGGIVSLFGLIIVGLTPLAACLFLNRRGGSRDGLAVSLGFTVALFMTMQVFAHLYSRAWFVPYFLTIWLIAKLATGRGRKYRPSATRQGHEQKMLTARSTPSVG